jgi:hypothetical protein
MQVADGSSHKQLRMPLRSNSLPGWQPRRQLTVGSLCRLLCTLQRTFPLPSRTEGKQDAQLVLFHLLVLELCWEHLLLHLLLW